MNCDFIRFSSVEFGSLNLELIKYHIPVIFSYIKQTKNPFQEVIFKGITSWCFCIRKLAPLSSGEKLTENHRDVMALTSTLLQPCDQRALMVTQRPTGAQKCTFIRRFLNRIVNYTWNSRSMSYNWMKYFTQMFKTSLNLLWEVE